MESSLRNDLSHLLDYRFSTLASIWQYGDTGPILERDRIVSSIK